MTIAKQLYTLQELDIALDRMHAQMSQAEEELGVGPSIDHLESALQKEMELLSQTQSQHRAQSLESESHRERSTRLDEQLYGGAVTNPRDLKSLEEEAVNARELLERLDAQLLELTIQSEESQNKRDSLQKQLADGQAAWEIRQGELRNDIKRWTEESDSMAEQRSALAATFDAVALQQYQRLRQSKGGQAVAKVERGLCQACRMALPTQQQQRVRSGRQTVLCNSCGRILFLS